MASTHLTFSALSDDQLLVEVKRLTAAERGAAATLIRSLMELDVRKLSLRDGCSSMFTYCTQVLRLAEGSAYNRIEAARAARRYPVILDALADGSITITAVRLLAPHLTAENHLTVLAAARHQSKREIERLVSALAPQPPVPTGIRKVSAAPRSPDAAPTRTTPTAVQVAAASTPDPSTAPQTGTPVTLPRSQTAVTSLSPACYKVQFSMSHETHDRLRRVQDLMRHTIPDGDVAAIFDRALTLLLRKVERRRCAASDTPRPSQPAPTHSRHIPSSVRREVWKRDEGRCTFVGAHGRCRETGFLELHHVQPYAVGGAATAENIRLRCRAHNAYEASLFFGQEADDIVREARPVCGHDSPNAESG